MFEFSQLSTFQLNARLRVKPINKIFNETILENVFLHDLNQYINDYRITRRWYLIDRNIAQRGKNGPNHVIPGWLKNMCARPGSSLACICVFVYRFGLEVFRQWGIFILLFNIIYYFRHVLFILSQYLYQLGFYCYLPLSVFKLKMWEDVCMYVLFHLSIYSPNTQSTCTLYKCSIAK